ncbi:AbrB/MazE/SpoVT family DNA-binding domain-containing protein [Gracilibacillus phocaeensis]|uniref:AbrB/MazE/SpoVT family DNA-binding domain-containing protein n=1 Tax=Gracilibacillus phocaeensis TaxID=2042304 RepID=UPI001030B5FC|nr:AbrB/MazE/SpoVT family DNA-binding domain-containing protein [Gracilibacillus phocaeensis]
MTTKAQKWGNSIGVRIPYKMAKKYGLENGTEIILEQKEKGILVKPIDQVPRLEELMADVTEENEHEELDFGKPEGDEIW